MEKTIRTAAPVDWPAVRSRLIALGETPSLRMIDGELAFPDEEIPSGWREVRLALRGGMVTVLRSETGIRTVVWGNADGSLQTSWTILNDILASSTDGFVESGPAD